MAKKGKTKKALTKRFRITSNKKMMHRTIGQNHFLAKGSGNKTRGKRVKRQFAFMSKTMKSVVTS